MIFVLSDDDTLVAVVRSAAGGEVVHAQGLRSGVPEVSDTALVVIDGMSDLERAFELAEAIDRQGFGAMVVLHAAPTREVFTRALPVGVRDILPPGSDVERVSEIVARHTELVAVRRGQVEVPGGSEHRVIAVVSPKGGAGTTMVAANLAVGLAMRAPRDVLLVDGDLQFGDVGNALRILPETTISHAVAGGLPDATSVKVHLVAHRTGLYVLCAPDRPGEADEITTGVFTKVIQLMGDEFPYVVVDTDPGLGERTLGVMDVATDVVLVAATDVSSVRAMRKTVEAMDRIGMTTARRHFVLNRSDAKVGLDLTDIASTVGMRPDVLVPSSRTVPMALNHGTPILEAENGSPVAAPLWQLVSRFLPESTAAEGSGRESRRAGGLFGRRSA